MKSSPSFDFVELERLELQRDRVRFAGQGTAVCVSQDPPFCCWTLLLGSSAFLHPFVLLISCLGWGAFAGPGLCVQPSLKSCFVSGVGFYLLPYPIPAFLENCMSWAGFVGLVLYVLPSLGLYFASAAGFYSILLFLI